MIMIKVNTNLSTGMLNQLRDEIMRQKDTGLIILPSYCSLQYVDEDDANVEILLKGPENV